MGQAADTGLNVSPGPGKVNNRRPRRRLRQTGGGGIFLRPTAGLFSLSGAEADPPDIHNHSHSRSLPCGAPSLISAAELGAARVGLLVALRTRGRAARGLN